MQRQITLFVSHASEDKETIARPLVKALRPHFNVWYDEDTIRLGDHLHAAIDEGLRTCDFGVVILSPAFFAKKWTEAEIGALFARETRHRRLILPVLHQMTPEELAAASPLMASRLAIPAAHGIPRVVEAIQFAVAASERMRSVLATPTVQEAVSEMISAVAAIRTRESFLDSAEGLAAIRESMADAVKQLVAAVPTGDRHYRVETKDAHRVRLHGRSLTLAISGLTPGGGRDAFIQVWVFEAQGPGERDADEAIVRTVWKPAVTAPGEQIRWVSPDTPRSVSIDEVVIDGVKKLRRQLELRACDAR